MFLESVKSELDQEYGHFDVLIYFNFDWDKNDVNECELAFGVNYFFAMPVGVDETREILYKIGY